MPREKYDIGIIGGGPGGYVAAIRAAQLGGKVVLVEEDSLGGVCLNWGCVPSKAMLRNAEIINLMKSAGQFGISFNDFSFDVNKAVSRSRRIVNRLGRGIEFLLKKNSVTHVKGRAEILTNGSILVDRDQEIAIKNIIIATGSSQRSLDLLETDGVSVITSKEILALTAVPKSLLIIGGGSTGIEFAYMYSAYGSKVTVVEAQDQILPKEDPEIADLLKKSLTGQGISIYTNARITSGEVKDGLVRCEIDVPNRETKTVIEAEKALISVGVSGNIFGIGLEGLDIETENGFIKIDEQMRTSVPNIYAIGDVTGKLLLAHVAQAQGVIAAEVIAGFDHDELIYDLIPRSTYCEPQISSFGYTEKEALDLGYSIKTGRFPLTANAKALAIGEDTGIVKVIVNKKNKNILGAHIIGPEATEIISELITVNQLGGEKEFLEKIIHPHPSIGEAIKEAALDVYDRAIHI
ncbi:MAG: dihydrolipoyl dehydrogenase [SAR202 cluster bacterium]|nr:dihydrolipoyl dehydrogenase [SAR202 cluster bacterium]|tara:strand:+ start:22091 stop:23482 length:1392 start_codon:yes stop_codon:yes gene_type:complete